MESLMEWIQDAEEKERLGQLLPDGQKENLNFNGFKYNPSSRQRNG